MVNRERIAMYPRTTHVEQHFTGSATFRDVVIGMSDGLTVPFALAAGHSGAVESSFLVLVASIAEMAAGSIAMGLGGYFAAKSEADSYPAELAASGARFLSFRMLRRRGFGRSFRTTTWPARHWRPQRPPSAPRRTAGCAL
jgi:ABC-type ATPase involved in cell division